MDVENRVRRGAKALDQRLPGWHWKINLSGLSMRSGSETIPTRRAFGCGCIGSQLDYLSRRKFGERWYTTYWIRGLNRFGITRLVTYGFLAGSREPESVYEDLDRAWTAEIRTRREADRRTLPGYRIRQLQRQPLV